MQTSNICGEPRFTPTIFSQDRFSNLRASTFVSHTLGICNPNSTLAPLCITLSTGSTVAHASTFSSPTNDWFKQSLHYAIAKTMTTCISGLPSQYTLIEQTIAVSKWPSSKSGNPDSTTRQRPVWPGHLMASCQTQVYSKTCSPNLNLHTVSKPSGTLDHHPRLRVKYEGKVRTDQDAQIE